MVTLVTADYARELQPLPMQAQAAYCPRENEACSSSNASAKLRTATSRRRVGDEDASAAKPPATMPLDARPAAATMPDSSHFSRVTPSAPLAPFRIGNKLAEFAPAPQMETLTNTTKRSAY